MMHGLPVVLLVKVVLLLVKGTAVALLVQVKALPVVWYVVIRVKALPVVWYVVIRVKALPVVCSQLELVPVSPSFGSKLLLGKDL
ncbi:unnamed protein product [Urochloa humidicola]